MFLIGSQTLLTLINFFSKDGDIYVIINLVRAIEDD